MLEPNEIMKILRHRRHLSQTECANIIGIAAINYGKRERGEANFTLPEVKLLLSFLQFDSCVIFEESDFDMADRQLRPANVTKFLKSIYAMTTDQLEKLAGSWRE